jgi:phosphoglycerol transferase
MKRIKNLLNIYVGIIILSIFILTCVLKLWKADLGIPLTVNGGDTLFNLVCIKGLKDSGWYFYNKFLGAPFGLELYDLPMADSIHLILLKILVILFDNSATALNLYFIAIFPLNAIATYFAFRCLKISRSVSLVTSLLYAFLPYSFFRGQGHLFLATYYTIPLITLIILSLWSNNLPWVSSNQNFKSKFVCHILTNRKSIFCIIVCIVLGSTGVYYAFFACIFIAVASISAFLYKRDKSVFVSALILIALISSSFFLNILPSLVYTYQHGVNQEVAQRIPSETEKFGLKITNLLLPLEKYRFPIPADSIKEYHRASQGNENIFAALGIIGSIGFLSLLFRSLFFASQTDRKKSSPSIYDRLALLNISALLYGIVGGFGTMFALLVTPLIRGTNRISIFIAFFSLLAVALFIDAINKKYVKNKRDKFIFNIFLIGVLLLGILDQTSPAFVPDYTGQKNEYLNDLGFVHTLERIIPTNSMVFQLPYVPFPENGLRNPSRMKDYDLFRGYLHSKNLRWSYGAIQGRHSNWHQAVSEEPLDNLLTKISFVGFNGIYIDRYGYPDMGNLMELEMEKKLGTKPIVSKNGRLVFFSMDLFNKKLRSSYDNEQIEENKLSALNPLKMEWGKGFYEQESLEGNSMLVQRWRWVQQQGTLIVTNPQSSTKHVKMTMSLQTVWPEYSNLRIESKLFSEVVRINNKGKVFEKTFLLPPGNHIINFYSDATEFNPPKDNRSLFFKVINFRIQEGIFENLKLDKLNPTEVEWKEGFYNTEWLLGEKWRWSDKQGTLILNNPTLKARETRLSMALATAWPDDSNLSLESDFFSEVVKINNKESVFEKTILLPPGKHIIKFSSDAKQANNAPGDTRKLFFRINDIVF